MTLATRLRITLAVALGALAAVGAGTIGYQHLVKPLTLTAEFRTATGIYAGDEVRIAGVKVGEVETISAAGDHLNLTLDIDRGIPVAADAKAVIVAQNLVAARYVQLTPSYQDSGQTLSDGALIPIARTAVPVEWDEVKDQLTRLATDLGPSGDNPATSLSRFIDSTAGALDENGIKLRNTLSQLSAVSRILADGSGNIVDTIRNLQTFITTLHDSNEQIVQFEDRLATLSSVLNGSRSDLDAALTNVSEVVGQVQRFVSGARSQTTEQLQRLADVTQNVVDHQKDLEQILHVAPTALANSYNIFDPRGGGAAGVFTFKNFSDPTFFFCTLISALENVTSPETGKLCSQYLGPALDSINFGDLPFPINPVLNATPRPSDLIYSEPDLVPGATPPPKLPEQPPAVSAYTGAGDVAPPPGYGTPEQRLPSLLLPSLTGPLPAEANPLPPPTSPPAQEVPTP